MLEEHFHMVLEWELFVHPAGAAEISAQIARVAPPVLSTVAAGMMCRHFKKQLHARGIARHSEDVIFAKGVADMQAVEALLDERPFLGGGRPAMADVAAYGLIAPMARWPMPTPVADYIKNRPALLAYIGRMHAARADMANAA